MSTHKVLALVATLALAPAGCEYLASPDPLALDPDAIFVTIVLVAGETRAHMLVGHPHRPASDPPPKVSASLIGPGWRATLTHKTDPKDGCGGGPTYWPIPMVCLNATLPEPIRERATYRLEGEGPMGPFTGETSVPAAPLILDPVDTVWVQDTTFRNLIRIPIRYRAPRDVGTLRPEAYGTFVGHNGTRSRWMSAAPRSLDPDGQADTVQLDHTPSRAFLHLLGIGWNYTRFRAGKTAYISFPWPNFGISGKGVYGYFDGSATSHPVHIVVDVPPGG